MKLLSVEKSLLFLQENKNRMSIKFRDFFPFVDVLIVNVDVYG